MGGCYQATVLQAMHEAYVESKTYEPKDEWLSDNWKGMYHPNNMSPIQNTGVPVDVLKEVRGTF